MKSTVARCAPLLIATILAGCGASPPARYYTLQPPGATQAVQAGVAPAPFMIEILPVNVPAQADQPQLMVRTGDGTVAPLYSERWSAPLPDEFRAALSDTLTRELGAPDVQVIKPASGTPVWRVQVDVQRFDLVAGGPSLLDATWRVRPVNLAAPALVCRTRVDVPAGGERDTAALVQAQQRGTALLARTIASAIRSQGQSAEAGGSEVQVLGCSRNDAKTAG